jgi:lysosomal acid lipase/cholesteryl ester hydrolase
MIKSYGYKCEIHEYKTEDGYINVLHRIPPTKKSPNKHQSVFLQHGLLGTSADYVMGSPKKSLGSKQ